MLLLTVSFFPLFSQLASLFSLLLALQLVLGLASLEFCWLSPPAAVSQELPHDGHSHYTPNSKSFAWGGTGTSSWACGAFFPLVIQLAVFGAWLMPTGSVRSLPHLLSTFAGRWEVPGSPVESCSLCQTGLWPALACFLAKVVNVEPFSADIALLVCLFSVVFFPFVFCRSLYPARTQIHTFSCNWFAKAYFCLYLARNIYSILRCRVVKSSHGINMRSTLPQLVNVAILVGKRVIPIKTHTGLVPALLFLNSPPFQRSTFVSGRSCRRDLQSPLSLPSSFLLRSL